MNPVLTTKLGQCIAEHYLLWRNVTVLAGMTLTSHPPISIREFVVWKHSMVRAA